LPKKAAKPKKSGYFPRCEKIIMKFYGFEKLSLIDYDGHTAATVFTGGCNFYCPYCHNGGLVDLKTAATFDEEEILAYLKKRVGLLDGLAVTGGEPTLYRELPSFLKKVKELGYDIKLDSNGTNPEMLVDLAKENLVDYFAMDIKSSPEKYPLAVGKENCDLSKINESIKFIISCGKKHEFRTTAVKEFVCKDDFYRIAEWISDAEKYVIQRYRDSEGCLSHGFTSLTEEEAKDCLQIVAKTVKSTFLRGF